MSLRIAGLSCLANSLLSLFSCVWHVVRLKYIVFLYHVKFLSLLYLSSASQLKVGSSMMGLPTLGTTFCILSMLSALTKAMAVPLHLLPLTAAYAIACTIVLSSVAILYIISICLQIAFKRQPYL